MENEMNASNVLLKTEDRVLELELIAEKVRLMLDEVSDYLTEANQDDFKLGRGSNEVKARIAFDYIIELERGLVRLKKQIKEVRDIERSSKATDRAVS